MSLQQLLLYVRTLRHLRPSQVTNRIWRKLYKPRIDDAPAPALRRFCAQPARFIVKRSAYVDSTRMRFLNVVASVETPRCWNDSSLSDLWLYQLHYFDELLAVGARERENWIRGLLERWMRENPPGEGIGWDPFPTSMRVVNIIKWLLMGNEPSDGLLRSLATQIRYLANTLEFHLGGNHLLTNAKALIFAGLFFDGQEADVWLKRGLEILEVELPEQFLGDGGHFERSPMYHAFMLEDALDLYNVARCVAQFPGSVLAELERRIWGMRRWLAAMVHPDKDIAFFNDVALGEAPTQEQLEEYARALGFGAVPQPSAGITHLSDTGFVRLQTDRAVVIADVGQIGPSYLPGHAHADTLSFELSLDGHRLITNSGTSTYVPGPQRDFERSTRAHSSVEVDEVSSSETWGSFRVARRAEPFDLNIEISLKAGARVYEVRCSHDGYCRLPGRVVHSRRWLLDDHSLLISDTLTGEFKRAISRFYCHPSWRVQPPLLLRDDQKVRVQASTTVMVESASYHPQFGMAIPCSCLTLSGRDSSFTAFFDWR